MNGVFRIFYLGNDETGGNLRGFLEAGGQLDRSVHRHDMDAEVRSSVVLPASGAPEAVAFPSVFAGNRWIRRIEMGVMKDEHAVLRGGVLRRRVLPLCGWRPDPTGLRAEPE